MKKLLLSTVMAFGFAAPAYAACTTTSGTGTGAALVQFYVGDCSSDNQANDGDDGKMFITKTTTVVGKVDGSLDKNSSLADDQNFLMNATGGAGITAFTDGNGFANIKSSDDKTQSFTIDPILPSDFDGAKAELTFPGFDGMLFRGQEVDLGGGAGKNDTGSITITVDLTNGLLSKSVTETITGIKLKSDFGVLGFDEVAGAPGYFVDSVTVATDSGHAFDQLKQIEFSVPTAIAQIPEPQTWAMFILGFGFLGALGWKRSRILRHTVEA